MSEHVTCVGFLRLVEGYFFYNLREALASLLATDRAEETTAIGSHPTAAGESSLKRKLHTGPQCCPHDFPELPFFPPDFQNSEPVESFVFHHHVKVKRRPPLEMCYFQVFIFIMTLGLRIYLLKYVSLFVLFKPFHFSKSRCLVKVSLF